MLRRWLPSLLAIALCLMTYGSMAAGPLVWVALSDTGGVYAEAAESLRAEVDRHQTARVEWRIAPFAQFGAARPQPAAVVAVGLGAQRAMQELFANDPTPPPLLAILVPRLGFERTADPGRLRAGSLSAVFIDQPAGRQLDLAQLALPSLQSIGVLVGSDSKAHLTLLEKAARDRGIRLQARQATADSLFSAIQEVLPEVEVLLAIPDPVVFNSQTAPNILAAAYRRRVPLIGFSPAYARAGALVSLYSKPSQIGHRGAELLRQALAGRGLPAPQWPRDFVVDVNQDVARSLGLILTESQLADLLRQKERQ